MLISEIDVYNLLKEKLGEQPAKALTEFIEQKIEKEVAHKKETLASKEDLYKVKIDLIKWVFAFWVTLMLLILGLYFKG